MKNKIVVVSKKRSIEEIKILIEKGYKDFAENRIEELMQKKEIFKEVNWHFIGNIQSKKIAKIVEHSALVQSVCSLKHLLLIDEEAKKINKIQKCLIQFNITNEIQKKGFKLEEKNTIFKLHLQNVKIIGIMVMGPDDSLLEIRKCFEQAKSLFDEITNDEITILSMGMSNDYQIALEYGANMLRLGTIMFNKY